MPPVLGPSPPSMHALEVLGRQHRQDGLAVGDREERHLRTVEVLLDDDPVAAGRVSQRLVAVLGHHDALAGGEPVVLDDVGRAERVERLRGLLGGAAHAGHRGRYVGRGHHVLGEGLGALEDGRLLRRPEAGDADRAYGVGDPRDQRRLRADDDQVDAEVAGEPGDRRSPSSGSTSWLVATPAVPGLPGAACTSVTSGRARAPGRGRARARRCRRRAPSSGPPGGASGASPSTGSGGTSVLG